MARSLTVNHQESPSALFAILMIFCAALLLLGATFGSSDAPAETAPAAASVAHTSP